MAFENLLWTLLWFFLALIPLVLVHEFGHFALAKLNRVHVEEFGIGFPPRVATLFRHGGTVYTVNALPLGGFVRLLGEDDPDIPGAFASKGKTARAAVLAAGPGANFLLASAIFTAIAMAGIPETVEGVRGVYIGAVEAGTPAENAGLLAGDVIVAIDGTVLADSGLGEPEPERGITTEMAALSDITAGAAEKPLDLTVLRGLTFVDVPAVPDSAELRPLERAWLEGAEVVSVGAGSKLQPGDVIMAEPNSQGKPVVVRGAQEMAVAITPAAVVDDQTGDTKGRMGIAMTAVSVPVRFTPLAAAAQGVKLTVGLLGRMVTTLGAMLTRDAPAEISGPAKIAELSRQYAEGGPTSFFGFMALLSLNLGLINLLPIPALDGGRLLFIGLEAVRGRRIEPAREQLVHVIGFVVVIGLMIVLTAVEVAEMLGVTR